MRSLFKFKGGVKPPTQKTQSVGEPIAAAPLPSHVSIPLHQSIGGTPRPIVQVGQEVELAAELVREHPGLFRAVEELQREAAQVRAEPEEAARARYDAHMAQRAQLRAGEDAAVRAQAELLAEQARAAQALAEEAQRQVAETTSQETTSQEAPPAQPVAPSATSQTESIPPHKRARKDS